MRSAKNLLWAFSLFMPLFILTTGNIFGIVPDEYTDDYKPEVTARVARISFITGDVQIRRAGFDEWERAVLNLPVVEGDEIATADNALLEIQFDRDNYARLSRNSYLKIVNLKDTGAALSLSEGILNLRILLFDKDTEFFEIDAPATTVAVLKTGMYRIDANDYRADEKAVRVTVTDGGQARVYSASAGFVLKNKRSARILIEGDNAGEWELADALDDFDEFDEWVAKRDAVITKRLKDAYYDKYYDRDIYGAEDLDGYGEWIYTRKYGYVWRPYSSTISGYDNWSPYRYGHWRFIPPYGWTWVNDEPWGWATYHHGRWIFADGYWVWTPYGLVRTQRSWWYPALIILRTSGRNVYWCPLPYDYGYYNYNSHYYRRKRRDRDNNNGNGTNNPPNNPPTNNPTTPPPPTAENIIRGTRNMTPPLQNIPPTGVVTVPASEFGKEKRGYTTPPLATAKEIFSKIPDNSETPPILPDFKDLNGKVSKEIRLEKPRIVKAETSVKIGAAERKFDAPMDKELQQRRIFGNRTPVTVSGEVKGGMTATPAEPPKTGAVSRPVFKQEDADPPNESNTPVKPSVPSRQPDRKVETPNQTPPIYSPPVEQREERRPPRVEPRREEPKYEPPPRREEPKYEPPPRSEPRNDPPPPKNDPPPQKSEPKEDSKPSPSENRKSGKDG